MYQNIQLITKRRNSPKCNITNCFLLLLIIIKTLAYYHYNNIIIIVLLSFIKLQNNFLNAY